MNKSAFLKLIKQVSDISDQQQSELEQVAATFPYCQTAHLLLAKSAYDKGSMLSTQRLRRASAYATDRQLLKRLIYASPVLEPAYADETVLADAATTDTVAIPAEVQHDDVIPATAAEITATEVTDKFEEEAIPETTAEEVEKSGITEGAIGNETAIPVADEAVAIPEAESELDSETLEQVYSHTSAENTLLAEQESETTEDSEDPGAEIDSELALLFTFSSIGPSSTDLIGRRNIATDIEEQAAEEPGGIDLTETAEALHNLEEVSEEAPTDLAAETNLEHSTEASVNEVTTDQENTASPETEENESSVPVAAVLEEDAIDESAAAAVLGSAAEDAEINYSLDEIDRLYAEDALGYWMGSSRMGEVLQLKDDYTRPRPQSFHPELILEYSRTHELEKAIHPPTHVLSKQLDIIDQFLKLNPRLKTMASLKLKPEPQEDLSLKNSKIKKGMASESLANIFIKQGKAKKAIKIYEQLILKYPEKKSYFAEQIEKLQNIT